MPSKYFSGAAATLLFLSGCASFSSSVLSRLDDNSFVGNSNGNLNMFCGTRPFKGVPITLAVTSHLDVFIEETYFMQPTPDATGGRQKLDNVSLNRPLRNVRAEPVKTKKVFLVDLKRPASGSLNASMTLNDQQYFDSITGRITDNTIKDSTALLATIITKLPTGKPAAAGEFEYLKRTRVVAYKQFDINAPDFELQLDTFVSQHLNCVGNACDYAKLEAAPDEGAVSVLANE